MRGDLAPAPLGGLSLPLPRGRGGAAAGVCGGIASSASEFARFLTVVVATVSRAGFSLALIAAEGRTGGTGAAAVTALSGTLLRLEFAMGSTCDGIAARPTSAPCLCTTPRSVIVRDVRGRHYFPRCGQQCSANAGLGGARRGSALVRAGGRADGGVMTLCTVAGGANCRVGAIS